MTAGGKVVRGVRVGTGLLLGASGALMTAASWQRWAGVCAWGDGGSRPCLLRQDDRYEFVLPAAPWEPVAASAELAGASILVLALALLLLPWALTARRPGMFSGAALVGAVLGLSSVGVATLRSGLVGEVVEPVGPRCSRRAAPAAGAAGAVRGVRPRVVAGRGGRPGPQHPARGHVLLRGRSL